MLPQQSPPSNPQQPSKTPDQPCSLQALVPQAPPQPASGPVPLDSKRSTGSASVNSFIQKTYRILQQKKYQSIIAWNDSFPQSSPSQHPGRPPFSYSNEGQSPSSRCNSFRIFNIKAFQEIVLPRYFKHSNMSSFVRQLNMYNFHKVRGDKNQFQFEHQKFVKNRPELLAQIKRKQVDSTYSIPSISLLPMHDAPDPAEPRPVPRVSFGGVSFRTEQHFTQSKGEIPESSAKLDHSENREQSNQDMEVKLIELQQMNRSLKKVRSTRGSVLRQLTTQSPTLLSNKFNKLLIALVSCKLQRQPNINEEARVESTALQQLIEKVLDNTPSKSFQEYYELVQALMQGKSDICSMHKMMSDG